MLTLLQPFLDPGSRTYFAALLVSGALALLLTRPGWTGLRAAAAAFLTPSSRLDVQLLLARQLDAVAGLFHSVLQPAPVGQAVDVHELRADRPAGDPRPVPRL